MEIMKGNNKYQFYLKNQYFIIEKKTCFYKKEIFKIERNKVLSIKYENPYDNMNFLIKILYSFFSIFWVPWMGGENVWKNYLIICYINDKEIVKSNLDVKLKEDEFSRLKEKFSSSF